MSSIPALASRKCFIFRESLGNFPKYASTGDEFFLVFRPDKYRELADLVSTEEFHVEAFPVRSGRVWSNWVSITPSDNSNACLPRSQENDWAWVVDPHRLGTRQLFLTDPDRSTN
jgi:hypothetical protein